MIWPRVRQRKRSAFRGGWRPVPFALVTALVPPFAASIVIEVTKARGGNTSGSDEDVRFMGMICGLGALSVYLVLARAHKIKLQRERDDDVARGGPQALFLRPFFSDRGVVFQNPFGIWTWLGGIMSLLPSQEFVGRILEPYIAVCQFGGRPKDVSNGKLSVPVLGDSWKARFKAAAEISSVLVVIPLLKKNRRRPDMEGEATLWELKQLLICNHLERTIVLMPPTLFRYSPRWLPASWQLARSSLSALGLDLPAYSRRGDVLTFDLVDGRWRARSFGDGRSGGRRIAIALVAALRWLSERHGFLLLDR